MTNSCNSSELNGSDNHSPRITAESTASNMHKKDSAGHHVSDIDDPQKETEALLLSSVSGHEANSHDTKKEDEKIDIEDNIRRPLTYRVSQTPPVHLLLLFAFQVFRFVDMFLALLCFTSSLLLNIQ